MEANPNEDEKELDLVYQREIPVAGLLLTAFIVLLVLKLTRVINWSWWVITVPIWVVPAIFLIAFVVVVYMNVLRSLRDSDSNFNPKQS